MRVVPYLFSITITAVFASRNTFRQVNRLYSSKVPAMFTTEWYSFGECQILFPPQIVPRSIIHFIGGFLAGSAVSIGYSELLSPLAESGHLIIANNIPAFDPNHGKTALNVSLEFLDCYKLLLEPTIGPEIANVPILGLSHSLGGKITSLINSNKSIRKLLPKKAGNIYLAFNNFRLLQGLEQATQLTPNAKQMYDSFNKLQNVMKSSVETTTIRNILQQSNRLIDEYISPNGTQTLINNFNFPRGLIPNNFEDDIKRKVKDAIESGAESVSRLANELEIPGLEFEPSPEQTWEIIKSGYNIQQNVLFKFDDDEIDQSLQLEDVLRKRGCDVVLLNVPGNHLTPISMSLLSGALTADSTRTQTIDADVFARYLPMAINRLLFEFDDRNDEEQHKVDRKFSLPVDL